MRLRDRPHHRGLHGHQHISRQRRTALIMIVTGLCRMACWVTLIALYLLGAHFTHVLLASVTFVALLSLYANAATDWGQVAASLAQLTAGDAHADSEHARASLAIDTAQLDADIAQLAALQPGPQAQALATEIRQRIGAQP